MYEMVDTKLDEPTKKIDREAKEWMNQKQFIMHIANLYYKKYKGEKVFFSLQNIPGKRICATLKVYPLDLEKTLVVESRDGSKRALDNYYNQELMKLHNHGMFPIFFIFNEYYGFHGGRVDKNFKPFYPTDSSSHENDDIFMLENLDKFYRPDPKKTE